MTLTHQPLDPLLVEEHRMQPLLAPRSVAVVGASRRRNTPGYDLLRNLDTEGFAGTVHPVNPRYDSVAGLPCHASIADLPEPVDLAVIAVPDRVVEEATREALEAGARSLILLGALTGGHPGPASSAVGHEVEDDSLRQRLTSMVAEAGVPVCGANCMGLVNVPHGLRAYSAFRPEPLVPGGVTYLAQSGSLLQALLFNDERLRFNLAVSTGQELVTTVTDYLEWALEQPATTAVALVLETIRDPDRFVAALATAAEREVPVVALTLGRTAAGARFAQSHTGAVAGDARILEALFRRYGVAQVRDLNELAATTLLLSQPRRPASGGLGAVLDSGGERALLVDSAADNGVPLAQISDQTVAILRETLDPGLTPENPVDAWGTGRDFEHVFERSLQALMADPDTGLGMLVADLADELDLHDGFVEVCRSVMRRTDKPLVVMSNYSAWGHRSYALRLARAGIPVIDGTAASLRAVRHAFAYRDFLARATVAPSAPSGDTASWWSTLPTRDRPLTEDEGYALLTSYGIAVPRHGVASCVEEAVATARTLGYPLVLKTAEPGVLHKSDVHAVLTGLRDEQALRAAYADLAARLGPRTLVCEQVDATVEMALGLVHDQDFGMFVMVALGGTWIELLDDARLAAVPLGHAAASDLLASLSLGRLLDGYRGQPACDRAAVVDALVRLSRLAADLGPVISELDINPLFVGATGVVAGDCLVVPRTVEPLSAEPALLEVAR